MDVEMQSKLPKGTDIELKVTNDGSAIECGLESPVRALAPPTRATSLFRLIFASAVAGGTQYGWALQLSLLTPYIETLGVSHSVSSFVWLGGPVAGFLVQPTIGLWSDRSHSRFGRRRPFIFFGCLVICLAELLIIFSADIGYALGDTKKECSVYKGRRVKAIVVYVIGFWVLDFAYNAVQGPARALMADIAGKHGWGTANSIFCAWMAAGNIAGYASSATAKWNRWVPSLLTKACCEECANMKGAFLVSIMVVFLSMIVTLICAREVPVLHSKDNCAENEEQTTGFIQIFKSFKNLPRGIVPVLIMTSLSWFAWFPFSLYDTTWIGREIYHGQVTGTPEQEIVFNDGVREGSFGLLLNSFVLAVAPFIIFPLCRKFTMKLVWVISNAILGLGMVASAIITKWSTIEYNRTIPHVLGPNPRVKVAAVALLTVLGIPLSVVYTVPFAATSHLASAGGGGQGLCIGVLNIAMVIPQVICSLGLGPWSKLLAKGKSDVPGFLLGAVVAFISSMVGVLILPKLSRSNTKSAGSGEH